MGKSTHISLADWLPEKRCTIGLKNNRFYLKPVTQTNMEEMLLKRFATENLKIDKLGGATITWETHGGVLGAWACVDFLAVR